MQNQFDVGHMSYQLLIPFWYLVCQYLGVGLEACLGIIKVWYYYS